MFSTSVYEWADGASPVLATFERDDYAAVIARPPGWAPVDLSRGNTGLGSVGRVEEGAFNFNGPCDSLPEAKGAVVGVAGGSRMVSWRASGFASPFGPGVE